MPQSRDPKTSPPAYLGEKLRRGRISAGFTSQDALAAELKLDRSTIGKIETGERIPKPDVLAAWCEACGLDLDLMVELAELARAADGPVPAWFQPWVDLEHVATSLRIWQPLLIPGLFQTADYARALFMATQSDTSDDAIDGLVSARIERQFILNRSEPPDVVCALDESVLYRLIATPAVMHDALNHVADMSERPTIVVQVVPAGNGANAGLGGAFDLANGDGIPDTLRQEGVEDSTSQLPGLLRKATANFNRVHGDALPRVQSRELIRKAAGTWKTA